MKIMVIDDDPMNLEAFKNVLTLFGYDVKAYNNPLSAVEILLKESNFDALITDFHMPELNGLEVINAINGKDIFLPTIMISATGRYEKYLDEIVKKSDFFLPKPVNLQTLLGFLEEIKERGEVI